MVADDTDSATLATVALMCEYIRAGIGDPQVKACAETAVSRFGRGDRRPESLCWAVFWYVKHCVKFTLDEGTMVAIGKPGRQDLLIAPAVLLRMKHPREDCDGFTMVVSALLAQLGVNVVIATVAANASEPWRWSHVFPCAVFPSGVIPLDASHGWAPGWMVPAPRIYRWQAYDLNGRPVDLHPLAIDRRAA